MKRAQGIGEIRNEWKNVQVLSPSFAKKTVDRRFIEIHRYDRASETGGKHRKPTGVASKIEDRLRRKCRQRRVQSALLLRPGVSRLRRERLSLVFVVSAVRTSLQGGATRCNMVSHTREKATLRRTTVEESEAEAALIPLVREPPNDRITEDFSSGDHGSGSVERSLIDALSHTGVLSPVHHLQREPEVWLEHQAVHLVNRLRRGIP